MHCMPPLKANYRLGHRTTTLWPEFLETRPPSRGSILSSTSPTAAAILSPQARVVMGPVVAAQGLGRSLCRVTFCYLFRNRSGEHAYYNRDDGTFRRSVDDSGRVGPTRARRPASRTGRPR